MDIQRFIDHVKEKAANPAFIHHAWFVKYHLEIVEKIALEICDRYPQVNRDFIRLLAWLHDYGKILDFNNQSQMTLDAGRKTLLEMGFAEDVVGHALECIATMDQHRTLDLHEAPLEVRIISSADAASHLVGPFYYLWWYENGNRPFEELMQTDIDKAMCDWHGKMVLPEVRQVFQTRHDFLLEQSGVIPERFLA